MSNEFKPRNGLIIPTETASTVPYLDANKKLVSSDVTPTELDYLDGVSSNIQTQLDSKASSSSVTDHLNDTADAHDASAISSVAAGNLAATTVQAALDELQTDIDTRATSNSPTLTTPSTDIITLDGQASTPANPSAGNYKVYVKDATQKLTVLDSTGAETTVGTGSGGGSTPNYIASTDGTAIGDWVTYDDGASSSPVDGTGGTPGVTFAISTSSAMRSTSNFLFTHDAADRQGEGFSYLMAIDPSDRGKVLRLSFDYLVASGTYADDGIAVWFYDATNAALIQPAPYLIKNSGLIEKFNCEVQVPSSCASLRVIFHVTTTTATAYTIRFDDFNFGPQAKLYGSPITDDVSYTPSPATLTLGNGTQTAYWSRSGNKLKCRYRLDFGTTTSITASQFTIPLPSGLTMTSIGTADAVGSAWLYDGSTTIHYTASVFTASTTTVRISPYNTSNAVTSTIPFTWTSTDIITAEFEVPILGWSSSVVMSSDASTRVVSLSAYRGTSDLTVTAATPLEVIFNFINTNGDTHGGHSTTTGRYTAKVPGWYRFSSNLAWGMGGTAASSIKAYAKKNGTGSASGYVEYTDLTSNKNYGVVTSGKIYLNAGDYISIWAECTSQNTTLLFSNLGITFEVERISGPAQIAASETVGALYTGAPPTGTLTNSYNTTTFGTKVKDSHGAYSAGSYTVPVSGQYDITARTRQNATYALGKFGISAIFVDGVQKYTGAVEAGGANTALYPEVNVRSIPLLAGQVVTIRSYNDATTPTFSSNADQSYFSIVKTGNY